MGRKSEKDGIDMYPPGEGIAAHSSVLAWRIPWTEEPGRLYNLATDQQQLSTNISNLITVDGKITDFKSTE